MFKNKTFIISLRNVIVMENESFFVKALGSAPLIRVLDFLMENRIFDYSKTDIARETGVSRSTLDSFWGDLIELGLIKPTRAIGRATLFKLDTDSESVKKMIEFDLALSKSYAKKAAETEKVKATA